MAAVIPGSFVNALKGITNEFEINRILGTIGCTTYIFCANIFVIVSILKGKPFDLTEYCVAFPGGLVLLGLTTAGAISIKDRNVATARVIQETGKVPAAPPAGLPVSQSDMPKGKKGG